MTTPARRRFCRDCGFVLRTGKRECPSCGSTSQAVVGDFVQPTKPANVPSISPPHPWTHLVWPEGATISLAAGQGRGKSSITMLMNAADSGLTIGAWFSTEQDPYQIASLALRLGVPVPPILPLPTEGAFDIARAKLRELSCGAGSVIVFDSLTPLGLGHAVQMMMLLIMEAREQGYRVVMINQTNKAEQVAGSAKLVFMPDIDAKITVDKFGRRRLYVGKNRYGPEYTRYFDFDRANNGAVVLPNFQGIAHSVEGNYPNLELVPYGLADGSIPGKPGQARGKKIQWASILDTIAEFGLLPQFAGYATAGAESAGTPDGLMYPPDWEGRRDFAIEHGMKWLSREEIGTSLAPTDWESLAVRLVKKRKRKKQKEGGEYVGPNDADLTSDDENYDPLPPSGDPDLTNPDDVEAPSAEAA